MKQLLLLLCLLLGIGHISTQHNHHGFYFKDSVNTGSLYTQVRSNGEIISLVSTGTSTFVVTTDSVYQNISIVNSGLTNRDSIIWLPSDTSSKYFMYVTHHFIRNDTSYFLGTCTPRPSNSWWTSSAPTNLFTFYLTPQNTLSAAHYLFEEDTIVNLPYWGSTYPRYNEHIEQFEFFATRYDSADSKPHLFLIRFNESGELKYYKTWDYTYPWTQDYLKVSDFQYLENGKYLLVQPNINDLYFFADTALNEVDTAYFDDPTRGLSCIIEKDNSYLLFGASDGYSFQSLQGGKAQYLFWELNKSDFSEKSRKVLKLKDTLTYEMRLEFFPKPVLRFDNGDYVFVASENCFRYDNGATDIFSGIYCVDSLYNLKWSYRVGDTLHGDSFGPAMIEKIPNSPNEFLWYCTWFPQPFVPVSEVWMRKINLDGSNLGLGSLSSQKSQSFSIYPNPAQNNCDILLPFLPDDNVQVQVIDMKGQVVWGQMHSQRDNLIRLHFDLPKGVYTVSVSTKGYQANQRLLVQ